MPRRTDEREKSTFAHGEELRGGALAPLDAADAIRPSENVVAADAPPEPVRGPGWWSRAVLAFAGGAVVVVGATRVLVQLVFGRLPIAGQSFVSDDVLMLFGLVALGVTLGPFLGEKTPTERELLRERRLPPWSISAVGILIILSMMMHDAWHGRDDKPARDPGVSIDELRWRAHARPDHLQSQLALGAAEHEAGRYVEADAPLARARDLAGGDGFVHPTERSLAQPEWKKQVQGLYAVNHAHLLPPRQALAYYNAAYILGDRSREVYRGLAEGWMARKDYPEVIRIAQEYLATIDRDPELVKLRDAAARIEWDRVYGSLDAVSARAIAWPGPEAAADIVEMNAAIEARLSPPLRESWNEARLGFAALQGALSTHSEQIDWKTGRMLAGIDDGGALAAAARHTRRAIELAPQAAHYRLQLGMIHVFAADYQAAVAAFDAAQRVDPHAFERFPTFAHFRRFATDRAAGRKQVQLWSFALVSPPPPDVTVHVP